MTQKISQPWPGLQMKNFRFFLFCIPSKLSGRLLEWDDRKIAVSCHGAAAGTGLCIKKTAPEHFRLRQSLQYSASSCRPTPDFQDSGIPVPAPQTDRPYESERRQNKFLRRHTPLSGSIPDPSGLPRDSHYMHPHSSFPE